MGLQQTLKALADPIRREILNMLKKRRMSAGEITEHFSVTAPSISRHLSVLKDADLYNTNRQNNFYCQCEAIGKSKEAFEYGISRNMQTRDVGRFFSR